MAVALSTTVRSSTPPFRKILIDIHGHTVNQDNFFRSVRNFVIDLTQMPASASATGLHWQVSQSTSLVNVVVNMSTASGNNHQGTNDAIECLFTPQT